MPQSDDEGELLLSRLVDGDPTLEALVLELAKKPYKPVHHPVSGKFMDTDPTDPDPNDYPHSPVTSHTPGGASPLDPAGSDPPGTPPVVSPSGIPLNEATLDQVAPTKVNKNGMRTLGTSKAGTDWPAVSSKKPFWWAQRLGEGDDRYKVVSPNEEKLGHIVKGADGKWRTEDPNSKGQGTGPGWDTRKLAFQAFVVNEKHKQEGGPDAAGNEEWYLDEPELELEPEKPHISDAFKQAATAEPEPEHEPAGASSAKKQQVLQVYKDNVFSDPAFAKEVKKKESGKHGLTVEDFDAVTAQALKEQDASAGEPSEPMSATKLVGDYPLNFTPLDPNNPNSSVTVTDDGDDEVAVVEPGPDSGWVESFIEDGEIVDEHWFKTYNEAKQKVMDEVGGYDAAGVTAAPDPAPPVSDTALPDQSAEPDEIHLEHGYLAVKVSPGHYIAATMNAGGGPEFNAKTYPDGTWFVTQSQQLGAFNTPGEAVSAAVSNEVKKSSAPPPPTAADLDGTPYTAVQEGGKWALHDESMPAGTAKLAEFDTEAEAAKQGLSLHQQDTLDAAAAAAADAAARERERLERAEEELTAPLASVLDGPSAREELSLPAGTPLDSDTAVDAAVSRVAADPERGLTRYELLSLTVLGNGSAYGARLDSASRDPQLDPELASKLRTRLAAFLDAQDVAEGSSYVSAQTHERALADAAESGHPHVVRAVIEPVRALTTRTGRVRALELVVGAELGDELASARRRAEDELGSVGAELADAMLTSDGDVPAAADPGGVLVKLTGSGGPSAEADAYIKTAADLLHQSADTGSALRKSLTESARGVLTSGEAPDPRALATLAAFRRHQELRRERRLPDSSDRTSSLYNAAHLPATDTRVDSPGVPAIEPGHKATSSPASQARKLLNQYRANRLLSGGIKSSPGKAKERAARRIASRLPDVAGEDALAAATGLRWLSDAIDGMRTERPGGDVWLRADNPDNPSLGLNVTPDAPADPADPPAGWFKLGTPEADAALREASASSLVQTWAQTSNDHDVDSLALQEAAVAEFGISGHAPWEMSEGLRERVDRHLNAHEELLRRFLRAQYDITQADLAAAGVERLDLYRGISFTNYSVPAWLEGVPKGESTLSNVRLRPMSSFTSDAATAQTFAGGGGGTGGGGQVKFTLHTSVPREQVLSYPQSGYGCLAEHEFVVLNPRGETRIRRS